ncbi:MAG: polysaccharide deacetylase family protein [Clostridia bacterium]|nr:polysaccharide deacetylase family protein [Clostridia bacterium]
MKNMFKVFLTIVILGVAIITGIALAEYYGKLEVPELRSQSMEYGSEDDRIESTELYEIRTKYYVAENEFVRASVREFIDNAISEFKRENVTPEKLRDKERAVLLQVIDTYSVNDNLVSIKITSMIKKTFEEEYTTTVDTFNYDLTQNKEIKLEDIFKREYKSKIEEQYSDKYNLRKNDIVFYNNTTESTCTYNNLKEYTNSKILTASNLSISDEEYNTLISNLIDKNKKMIAITFDDGPHKTNTQQILNILSKYNAKATFFMLGQNVEYYPNVVKEVANQGHEIGIHTWSHPQLTKLSESEIAKEINNTAQAIKNITGVEPWLVRPPYGALNSTVKSVVPNPFILWNIDSLDWKSRDKEQIVPLVLNDVQDGDIILLHDIHSTTVPAVEEIVKYLYDNDYQIITVSQMLEAKGYDTTTTRVFYSGRQ